MRKRRSPRHSSPSKPIRRASGNRRCAPQCRSRRCRPRRSVSLPSTISTTPKSHPARMQRADHVDVARSRICAAAAVRPGNSTVLSGNSAMSPCGIGRLVSRVRARCERREQPRVQAAETAVAHDQQRDRRRAESRASALTSASRSSTTCARAPSGATALAHVPAQLRRRVQPDSHRPPPARRPASA